MDYEIKIIPELLGLYYLFFVDYCLYLDYFTLFMRNNLLCPPFSVVLPITFPLSHSNH